MIELSYSPLPFLLLTTSCGMRWERYIGGGIFGEVYSAIESWQVFRHSNIYVKLPTNALSLNCLLRIKRFLRVWFFESVRIKQLNLDVGDKKRVINHMIVGLHKVQ
jgi:hypothetical protein